MEKFEPIMDNMGLMIGEQFRNAIFITIKYTPEWEQLIGRRPVRGQLKVRQVTMIKA